MQWLLFEKSPQFSLFCEKYINWYNVRMEFLAPIYEKWFQGAEKDESKRSKKKEVLVVGPRVGRCNKKKPTEGCSILLRWGKKRGNARRQPTFWWKERIGNYLWIVEAFKRLDGPDERALGKMNNGGLKRRVRAWGVYKGAVKDIVGLLFPHSNIATKSYPSRGPMTLTLNNKVEKKLYFFFPTPSDGHQFILNFNSKTSFLFPEIAE